MNEHYKDHWKRGVYKCSKCGSRLFHSDAKFDSGTAWPSFREGIAGAISTKPDHSLGMERTEIVCGKCGHHLGHVFDDGKIVGDTHPKAGARNCVLSDSLEFEDGNEK